MSFTVMKCPVCGAPLRMEKNKNYIVCDSCDTALRLNEEQRLFRVDDAEEFGYNFEKGRQRARQERQDHSQDRHVPEPQYTYVPPRQAVSDKDRKTALLICIFLGVYGGHQYYVGNIGKGLLYTFTFGLFCIGWIIDLISIATGSFRDKHGRLLVNLNSYDLQGGAGSGYRYGHPGGNRGPGMHTDPYFDPELAEKNRNANKRRIFFALAVVGLLGILGALTDGDMSGILACAVWTFVFFILWKKTGPV